MNLKLDSNRLVSGLAFGAGCKCSDPIKFGEIVASFYGNEEFDSTNSSLNWLENIFDHLKVKIEQDDYKQKSLLKCVNQDLYKIIEFSKTLPADLIDPNALSDHTNVLMNEARILGLDVEFADLRIVENFPSPYDKAQFAAMTYDRSDERNYGIRPGVAVKKNSIRPLYTIGLFAHELIHVAIGRFDRPFLARGLEEGFADLIGGVELASAVVPKNVTEQVVLTSRLRYDRNQLGRLYRDGLIQISGLAIEVGDDVLLDYVVAANQKGRDVIKELEGKAGMPNMVSVAQNVSGKNSLRRFAQRFLSMSPDLVVSPTAFLVGLEGKIGDSIENISDQLELSKNVVEDAFKEMQSRAFLTVVFEGKVCTNEAPFYDTLNQFRYEV